jgi:hypothetical protein
VANKLNPTEVYYAGLVIQATAGQKEARRALFDNMNGTVPAEIEEWYGLCLDLNIRVDSPQHIRLNELSAKYETDQVYRAIAE